MAETPALDTVTEALAFLAAKGYDCDLVLAPGGVRPTGDTEVVLPEACTVDYQFRFEGESDPSDEDIVLGVTLRDGRKGVVSSAYGKDMDAEHIAVIQALTTAH